jgi:hypothetical protein
LYGQIIIVPLSGQDIFSIKFGHRKFFIT